MNLTTPLNLLGLLFAAGLALAAAAAEPGETILWHDQPAGENWLAAYPQGNGRLGAMVFGNPDRERIALNDNTLYALEPETCMHRTDIRPDLPRVIEMVRAGRFAEAEEFIRAHWLGRSNAPYQPLGDLLLQFPAAGEVTEYRRELDLADAIARVDYTRAGVRFRREVFLSHPDQVLVVRLTADRPGAIELLVGLDTPHKPTTSRRVEAAGTLVMSGQGPGEALRRELAQVEAWGDQRKYPAFYEPDGTGGYRRRIDDPAKVVLYGDEVDGRGTFFEARVRVLAEGGQVEPSAAGDALHVKGADAVTLLLSAATSFNGFDKSPSREGLDPAVAAARDLDRAAARPYEDLRARHIADHQALFGRVALRLGEPTPAAARPTDQRIANYAAGDDPALAALYYQFARYLMIAGSRPGGQPLNLQGLWNEQIIPPWNSGYTVNINIQMNYWPAARGGLAECEEPLFRLLREAAVTGERTAREMFGARGWCMFHNTSIWRETAPVDGQTRFSWWPLAGGWFSQHIWSHYQMTLDRDFLARMYPVLRGAALFQLDWLIDRGDGVWVTPLGTSPENSFLYPENGAPVRSAITMGTTMDMAIIRELFRNTASAAELLDRDPELRAELRAKADLLLPYAIGRHGQLQEWDQDFDEAERGHRHLSHLYGFHPGEEITPESRPDLLDPIRTTLDRRGDVSGNWGWSLAWKMCIWARLGDGPHVGQLLTHLLQPATTAPNLFNVCPVFQIDGNFGAAHGITEALLQDHRGWIELLPALPPEWSSGAVRGLRARGGFIVDMEWHDGRLTSATIHSEAGAPLTLRHAGRTIQLVIPKGESRSVIDGGVLAGMAALE